MICDYNTDIKRFLKSLKIYMKSMLMSLSYLCIPGEYNSYVHMYQL